MLFDTHAHYDDERFDEDRDALLASMPENNVGLILNPGLRCRNLTQGSQLRKPLSVCLCCGRPASGEYRGWMDAGTG